ncbi:PEP/pyruvate-binding domain-containing protein [Arthrobacter globiformis]|uniref:PEP/pyruvate-binding domain-containing protein n=1 Tax=Arthrobacter globiformis TaxID=1665 RepID=UPI0027842C2E|nr:PEP/pyruvate-binding domain-containing protein [Arthrobacter globiformis]MDQ0863205.1 phosphohistidine swiveling domain-containing protein [Arthrobacter globiformis]
MSRLVLGLGDLSASMLPQAGGKAANLGELLAAGLPVPEGFCLTTEAYAQAVRPLGLEEVHSALQDTPADDLEALADLAGRARSLIAGPELPTAIAREILTAYRALDGVPVAVRSSATAEDLPFASFAGQQDTYLNVIDAVALLDAVRKCWASLWTDRAVAYRASRNIDPATVALAVVVQRMVDAEAAGVMFTANPVTGRRREAVIDASSGLGEAVVSGAVNPDHFVVDTASGAILQRRLGDKRRAVRPLPGGGTEYVEQGTAQGAGTDQPCLTDAQIRELAALGSKAEAHYGAPQDTEWALDGDGKVWLTQSRPITTLYPLPEKARPAEKDPLPEKARERRSPAEELRVYLCFSLAQGLTRPLTPMGLAALRRIGSSVAAAAGFDVPDPRSGPPPYFEAGQRIFVDLTAAARSTVGRRIIPNVFDVMEARSAKVLRSVFDDPRLSITRRTPWDLLRHVVPLAARARVPEAAIRALVRPEAALKRLNRFTTEFNATLELPQGASPRARLDHAEGILSRLFPNLPAVLPLAGLGFAMLGLAGKLLGAGKLFGAGKDSAGQDSAGKDSAGPGSAGPNRNIDLQPVLRGLPNNVTTEMDLELWRIAVAIRSDAESVAALTGHPPTVLAQRFAAGDLPAAAQTGLAEFLARFGHRAVAEIDVGMPRWRDDPTHILGVLANYLRLEDPERAPDRQFSKAAAEADAHIERLVAEARSRGRLRAMAVQAALRRARLFAGLRELPKFQIVLALAEVRKQLAEVGAVLAEQKRLARADDIFFLDFAEANQALDGADMQDLVAQRQGAYYLELERRHIPRMLLSDGTEPETLLTAVGTADAGALSGSPASAGTVTAPARVILDPVGAHLEPGEILVAPSTDPGWTPLFLTAGGLVMEMGGPNSHGGVVAREYGIPAVVGVADATSLLRTGQEVTVDGGAGTVVPGA